MPKRGIARAGAVVKFWVAALPHLQYVGYCCPLNTNPGYASDVEMHKLKQWVKNLTRD
jgi:hypothetical protein